MKMHSLHKNFKIIHTRNNYSAANLKLTFKDCGRTSNYMTITNCIAPCVFVGEISCIRSPHEQFPTTLLDINT